MAAITVEKELKLPECIIWQEPSVIDGLMKELGLDGGSFEGLAKAGVAEPKYSTAEIEDETPATASSEE